MKKIKKRKNKKNMKMRKTKNKNKRREKILVQKENGDEESVEEEGKNAEVYQNQEEDNSDGGIMDPIE